jgi:hypothetical protein
VSLSLKEGMLIMKGEGEFSEAYQGLLKKGDRVQLVVNRELQQAYLYHNGKLVADFKTAQLAAGNPLYPFVCMSSKKDILEFL